MGRRLVIGTVSRSRLAALAPLGYVDGLPVYPFHAAEDDKDPANGGDDNDDDADDDSDEDDSDDDDADDKNSDDKKRRPRRNRSTSSELHSLKRERNRLLRQVQEREKKDREAELAKKPEMDRAVAERDDAVKERDELKEKFASARTELEIIKASHGKFNWVDIEDVLNDRVLRNAIEIGDDGELTGVKEALKDLAKRKPHYLGRTTEESGSNSNGNSNGRSGSNPGSNGNNNAAADRAALNAKYPILSRLPQ